MRHVGELVNAANEPFAEGKFDEPHFYECANINVVDNPECNEENCFRIWQSFKNNLSEGLIKTFYKKYFSIKLTGYVKQLV